MHLSAPNDFGARGLEAVLEELQHGSGAALLRFPATWIDELGEDACERCFLGLCTLVRWKIIILEWAVCVFFCLLKLPILCGCWRVN